jgi:flagellar secretion chaperone FliS
MANKGNYLSAIGKYKKVDMHSAVLSASPHRLVQLLFDGAIARVAEAKGHTERGDMPRKVASISACVNIVNGLRGSLNMEKGGEIAIHLDQLYDYIARRLIAANRRNDLAALAEVQQLLHDLRKGWEGIRDNAEGSSDNALNAQA